MAVYRQVKSKNKFNAKGRTYNGRWYHSTGEMNYAQELDWLKKSGEIKEWIPQFKIELRVNGILICNYFCDFKIITNHGSVEFHEYKGVKLQDWMIKWKLLQALKDEIEPGCELVLIEHKSRPPKWKKK
jgi:hypothetical protein